MAAPWADPSEDVVGRTERLALGARALGVHLTEAQTDRLLRYQATLEAWNSVHNLSGLRNPEASLEKNLLDSLAIVAPLGRCLDTAAHILDVGSGAGLPAVVLAIARPDWEVLAVDAVAKKVAFVRQVAGELRIANMHVRHARVEQIERSAGRGFDLITSRAFGSLAQLVAVSRRVLRPGGVWVAMKGHRPDAEIAALPDSIEVFHVEPVRVPGVDADRCLVWMRECS
ncbi:MAG: 16S rRNA (guanine(527)-N(7))-methyltransferase RsmG [Ideonella sp.]|nr:16S rRNA (guanine(527)-N(7))-methyltransferase RsmG [Ideonella sp.]MCC7456669.1 16S rRNA (guanine(527)-N(7))-methyltransferase RsmG [Nitrospira sp.]